MDLVPDDDVRSFLERLAADPRVGRIMVRLTEGTHLTGTIGPIGNRAVILKALGGRAFYDAYVRFEAVATIEVQTRA
jgi:hypothetical protein